MGLPPLEYIDCFLDSPSFREMLKEYEKELEENSACVKQLVKECKRMIAATEEFSKVQRSFAHTLGNFRFQTIGEQTEDEKMIINSLQTFAKLLFNIEDCRHNMLTTISVRLLETLERFRREHIQKAKEEKKRFDRATERYYKVLDNNLSTSSKKKEAVLTEVDNTLEKEHLGFRQASFDYVCKLQDVHAQKQYELIEPIIGYISDVSTFLHQAYDGASSLKPELSAVQFKVQILRDRHLEELERAYELKAQVIEDGEAGLVHHPVYLRQGYLMVQDAKRTGLGPLGGGWHRYFCQFKKQDQGAKGKAKLMRMSPVGHHGLLPSQDFMEVKNVVRSRSDEVDRRFCFECELYSLKGESRKVLIQASTNEDRKAWLDVMEGKEPVYTSLKVMEVGGVNPQGFVFVKKCIDVIESRGLDEEGLYRKPGVLSKANKLIKDALERGKVDSIDITDEFDWDTKTLASAIKGYFSKHLGAPLLTFELHGQFIEVAKIPDHSMRVEAIAELVHQLPDANRKMLHILIEHLNKIALCSNTNLMKASNIGVVFGPTLMRPERESVATIVDIKYQNIVVEVMVEHMEKVFATCDSNNWSKKTSVPSVPSVPTTGIGDGPPKRPSRRSKGQQQPEPPPRPLPPTPANPNIPPPTIPRTYTSKTPEPSPYEQPIPRGNHDGSKKKPPVPKNKPVLPHRTPSTGASDARPSVNRTESMSAKTGQAQRERSPPPPDPGSMPWRDQAQVGKNARALYDCDAEDSLELSFSRDEILYIVSSSEEPEWMVAKRTDGKSGLVPANYIELLP